MRETRESKNASQQAHVGKETVSEHQGRRRETVKRTKPKEDLRMWSVGKCCADNVIERRMERSAEITIQASTRLSRWYVTGTSENSDKGLEPGNNLLAT